MLLSQPQPTIPDELRDADLEHVAFEGRFHGTHPDGTATCENGLFDGKRHSGRALALDCRDNVGRSARLTRDGQPVESYLRLRVEFKVTS